MERGQRPRPTSRSPTPRPAAERSQPHGGLYFLFQEASTHNRCKPFDLDAGARGGGKKGGHGGSVRVALRGAADAADDPRRRQQRPRTTNPRQAKDPNRPRLQTSTIQTNPPPTSFLRPPAKRHTI